MEIKIKEQDVEKIISTICDRKYSLACFFLLRSLRINPQQYFPARTFYRIVSAEKEYMKNSRQ
jgi:hypothetical protein